MAVKKFYCKKLAFFRAHLTRREKMPFPKNLCSVQCSYFSEQKFWILHAWKYCPRHTNISIRYFVTPL